MEKFTSGPWSINNWPQSNSDIVIGAIGTPRIAKVILRDVSINEQKANARLIAAAPDMYKVLKDLLNMRSKCFIPNDDDWWDEAAFAAIAKVEEKEGV